MSIDIAAIGEALGQAINIGQGIVKDTKPGSEGGTKVTRNEFATDLHPHLVLEADLLARIVGGGEIAKDIEGMLLAAFNAIEHSLPTA